MADENPTRELVRAICSLSGSLWGLAVALIALGCVAYVSLLLTGVVDG